MAAEQTLVQTGTQALTQQPEPLYTYPTQASPLTAAQVSPYAASSPTETNAMLALPQTTAASELTTASLLANLGSKRRTSLFAEQASQQVTQLAQTAVQSTSQDQVIRLPPKDES
jgi:hypothetical protein